MQKEDCLNAEGRFLDKQRDYSFDRGYYMSKIYLEDEKLKKKTKINEVPTNGSRLILDDDGLDRLLFSSKKNKKNINYILSERFCSDDEKEKQRANLYLSKNYPDPYLVWSYFLEYFSKMKKFFLKNKIVQAFKSNKERAEKKKYLAKRRLEEEEEAKQSRLLLKNSLKENNNPIKIINNNNKKEEKVVKLKKVEDDIIDLVDNFNKTIDQKIQSLENYMLRKKSRKNFIRPDCPDKRTLKMKKEMVARTKLLIKNFLLGLQLFQFSKESRADYDLSEKKIGKKDLKYVIQNKKNSDNIYYDIDKTVNSSIPSLFHFNIPKILEKYQNFSRTELFDLFVQYKVIMKISIALKKDRSLAKKGIDFQGFYKGVHQVSNESPELALKIFDVINESKNNYLTLDEFLKGMSIIKSEEMSDKVDMFFKIIDSDGNGMLSWDEVYDISMMSLKRSLVIDEVKNEGLISELAEYFADLIFRLVDIDKEDEIPLPKIKEVINCLIRILFQILIFFCFY